MLSLEAIFWSLQALFTAKIIDTECPFANKLAELAHGLPDSSQQLYSSFYDGLMDANY